MKDNLLNNLKDNKEHNFNWEKFQNYIDTYNVDELSPGDKSTIEDILYGIAISIDENTYRYSDGYNLFKKHLKEWL